ncbi:hypothetical protein BS333_20805 (plasmid) [Vibrio azureus]|uniref:Conjugal transfer protein TraN n=1 Tax=Vibrio azureus NBRC 104587 TaxID=1219077 RepID=U3CA85_9VIBR|nr:conjugal transfer protein TraN [Vibrio azureus]AUI88818.1 hypothetical protein BS333_20805 [Vibrio azureus]GAD75293.1 hypothetical protein VAZ01S_023_00600 [Vibrio azureus NBRC 104587]
MLRDRFDGVVGRLISYVVMITTTLLPLRMAYAQQEFDQAIANANSFGQSMLNQRANPTYDAEGNLLVDGQVYMSQKQITGQRDNDYLPAGVDVYGSDAQTIMQGQAAQKKYEEKTLATAETSGERAYHILKKSISNQKPDLTNDPIWAATDDVFNNLEVIAQDFANCTIDKELVSNGKSYHVPVYKTCERLPAIEDNYSIFHEYEVGVIKHHSGATNIASCGDGCTTLWLGTIGDNYWSGNCTIYEQEMQVEVIQPQAIQSAIVDYAKFDDWFQIYLNGEKVYNGPYPDQFPPETDGRCELSNSWVKRPNINVLNSFRSIPEKGILTFKNRTSVSGNGEGYAKITINYDASDLVYAESWSDQEQIDKAYAIKKQADDGFCEASFTCANMPATVDENGCAVINGIRVCEENFDDNPLSDLGISPFCQRIDIESNCGFNEGQICTTNIEGVETCFDNDTVENNQCAQYENDSTCSYIKTECVEGAEGASGECYVQLDTYDCGFDASTGTTHEEEVLRCDGQIQCIGESCYSPERDLANNDFGEVNAYLEMLRYAQADMTCEGIPERPFDPVNPPDRYEPVPSCPAGSVYDKTSGKCLAQTACTYSDNDFFAVSRRDGIQVLLNNMVVANEPSVLTCTTLIKNDSAYTCGEARKNVGTDTFYEVCTNTVSEPTPNTCPSDEHELNENTGYCEVPPIVTCSDGFMLHQGNDLWSSEDDFCRLETPVTYNCDKLHENYNPETGVCEGLLYDVATCDDPMDLVNDICTATLTKPVKCPSGQSFNSSTGRCSQTLYSRAQCPSGSSLSNDRCNGLLVQNASCPSGQTLKGGMCSATLTSAALCRQGGRLREGKCQGIDTHPFGCKSGFELKGLKCVSKDAECRGPTSNNRCSYTTGSQFGSTSYYWNGEEIRGMWAALKVGLSCSLPGTKVGEFECTNMSSGRKKICEIWESTICHSPVESPCNAIDGFVIGDGSQGLCGKSYSEPPLCQAGYGYNIETNKCEKTINSNPICDTGYHFNLTTNKCELEIDTSPICTTGYSYDPVANKCKRIVESEPQCQTGYEYQDGFCYKEISSAPNCPDGYAYSTITGQCELATSTQPRLSCDTEGTSYHAPSNTCRLEVDVEQSCPSSFPVWSDDENRCMSGSLSPLAKVRTKLESNADIDGNNPNEAQALIAYAVAPFSYLASALLPTAYAEEVAEPEGSVTQDTMNAYIGEKFEYAAQTFDYQKAMFAQGQSQLLGGMSSSAPSDGQGTTNVQCELFKGEAMECKQAVGGMQDCCESPVTVSLGDYITLTRHMMSMDSITGQVFGLEGYTGVWDIASNWASEATSTAFDAVQSTFTSGADVVAQQGTEVVGEGAVNAIAQSMMSYTNTFLTETFGAEVAGMFFQQAGIDSAGNAILGASPQMAAAGQALMYCYYAYLAYVVFNLLVNIIFACEEEELDLAMKVELLSAHYLGSYCKTEVLGACLEKRKSYCAYDSPLSRILMEQIYQQPQMGLSWGSAKNPNCSGLSIEDIGNVDWDQVNLDEWVGILIETDNFIQDDVIDIERLTGRGSLLNYGETPETERQNVLEKNTERFDAIDVDEVRRDAYEDAWNEQHN